MYPRIITGLRWCLESHVPRHPFQSAPFDEIRMLSTVPGLATAYNIMSYLVLAHLHS
jgi:hypothetical protein